MKKLRFFLIFLLFPSILFAQQGTTKIILQGSSVMNVDTKTNITKLKNPVFSHDNAILTSDSAYFYTERNYVEFFSKVHINQSDTLNIFSDFLNYDGNTKNAHLTGNVILKDKTSTLTTDLLDYNTGTRIGQYYNGGKIVNKDVTLTSKRGWYFAKDKDAFFKYNVVTVTPQSTITTDTMQYNTLSNWTKFFGPTNIKGKDDNLYTENGAYNTATENAFFGKKNLYTQGTKSLKGDSLYYNGKKGYGKAVKNISFMDSQDKTLLRGQLGEYYKADERVVVTKNAYFAMGTKDSITVGKKKIPDSLFLGADTLETQRVLLKSLKVLSRPVVKKNNEVGADDEKEKAEKEKEKAEARKQAAEEAKIKKTAAAPVTTAKLSRKERKLAEQKAKDLKNNPPTQQQLDRAKFLSDSIRTDSLKADSLLRKIVISKLVVAKKDTVKTDKKTAVKTTDKNATLANSNANKAKVGTLPTLKKDSVIAFNPADTVRTRAIRAYHNVRVFKSNMQAKADSLFYTAADSTLRWYKNPILWSEGTQQTGDTIHVFFKNDKMHSFQVLQNGFIVNVETDSTKFNQVKGKLITGFFVDGNVRDVYVDGNAESIYYNKDDKGIYQNMSQSVSGRIRFKFDSKELTDITYVKGDEGVTYPIDKLPKETLLTGFIWKPELRPVSKADIIKGLPTKKAPVKSKVSSKPKTVPTTTKGKDPSGIKPILPVKKPEVKPILKEEKITDSAQKEIKPIAKIDTLKKN